MSRETALKLCSITLLIAMILGACSPAATPTAVPVSTEAPVQAAPPTTPPTEAPAAVEAPPEPTQPPPPPAPQTIKFGTALELSGWAVGDTELAHTMDYDLWVEQLNDQGGIYVKDYDMRIPIELIVYDSESDIAKTVSLTEKLILEDKVDVILPPWATAFTFAVAPIINEYKYPMIGTTEASAQLREAQFPYYFGLWNPATVVADAVVGLIDEVGVKSVAVIFVGTLYGIDQSSLILPVLGGAGIDVRLVESYPLGVTDLSPLLKKIKELNPDALLSLSYPADAMLIQEQMTVIDFNPQLFYNSLSGYPQQRDKFGGEAVEGMISEGAWNRGFTPDSAAFYDAFMSKWNREPAWDTAITWASLQIWEQVLREVGLDHEKQRDYLSNTVFDTIYGKVKFTDGYNLNIGDPNGANPPVLGQWQDGIFEVIWPADLRTKTLIFPKPAWP